MLWQSEEEEEKKKTRERLRLRHPPGLPPPSWKHRVRGLSLHVLIMINAGTTTHTLKPRFWPGSLLGPAVLRAAVNTFVWLVKSSSSQTSKVSGGQLSSKVLTGQFEEEPSAPEPVHTLIQN